MPLANLKKSKGLRITEEKPRRKTTFNAGKRLTHMKAWSRPWLDLPCECIGSKPGCDPEIGLEYWLFLKVT